MFNTSQIKTMNVCGYKNRCIGWRLATDENNDKQLVACCHYEWGIDGMIRRVLPQMKTMINNGWHAATMNGV
jgi:hypothetical protein